jgi:hypothetical protein
MTIDTKSLRALALAATQPGPWTVVKEPQGKGRASYRVVDSNGFYLADFDDAPHDAAFVAAASPDVVIALLDECNPRCSRRFQVSDAGELAQAVAVFDAHEVAASCHANDERPTCLDCGGEYVMESGDEPTPFCDACAHTNVQRFAAENGTLRARVGELEKERDEEVHYRNKLEDGLKLANRTCERRGTERDAARAEAERMRPVVAAAIKYVGPDGEDSSELDTAVEDYLTAHSTADGGTL